MMIAKTRARWGWMVAWALSAVPLLMVPALGEYEALSWDALANAEYLSEWTAEGTVRLVDGEFRQSVVEGGATELVIRLLDVAFGDLDGDGIDDAVGILVTDAGGSGTFFDLAVMVNRQGRPVNVASELLGDRVRLLALTIRDGRMAVELRVQGPDDALCCPTLWVTRMYSLVDGRLLRHSDLLAPPEQLGGTLSLDTRWLWVSWLDTERGEQPVDDPQQSTLAFSNDGTYRVKADCNLASGGFEIDGDRLTLLPGPTTLAMCAPESLSSEYLARLGAVVGWSIEGERLRLHLADGGGALIFEQEPELITGIAWAWIGLVETMPAAQSVVPHPERYTLVLHPDGTLNLRADCNQVMGTYLLEEGSLRIQLGPSTRAYCGETSLDVRFLELLSLASGFEVQDGELVLLLADDAGRMLFQKSEEA